MTDQDTQYVLVAIGTAGDVYPFIGLAKKFRECGRKVTLIGSEFHRNLFLASGLPFVTIGTSKDYVKRYNNADIWNPQRAFGALFTDFSLQWSQMATALRSLQTKELCVIVAHQIALPAAAIVRETGGNVKIVGVCLAPSNLRTCHDPLNIGPVHIPKWVPMSWRRLAWWLVEKLMIDPVSVAEVNAARSTAGLPAIKCYLQHVAEVSDMSVMLVPKWFAEPHPDWPSPLLMAEFPLYDPLEGQQLPPDLTHFLSAPDKPVVFTPGTGQMHAASYFGWATAASARLGRRAIFLTPHRAQIQAELPDSIHWQSYVSLKTLLPHVAALVHHGGIGTTAEALRAGIPQLVVPFAWDQFDNGARMEALGVGKVIPAKKLGIRKLEQGLETLLSTSAMRAQCTRNAERFAASVDPEGLCRDIDKMLGITRNSHSEDCDPSVVSGA